MSAEKPSHLTNTAEVRIELRATNQRIHSLGEGVEKRFEKIDQQIRDLKDSLASARLWAVVPWAALATAALFYAMARGFQWT
jgi:hypothetical protein